MEVILSSVIEKMYDADLCVCVCVCVCVYACVYMCVGSRIQCLV